MIMNNAELNTKLIHQDTLTRAADLAMNSGLHHAASLFRGKHWSTSVGPKGGTSYSVSRTFRRREFGQWIRTVCPTTMFYNALLEAMAYTPNLKVWVPSERHQALHRAAIRNDVGGRCGWCGSAEGFDTAEETGDWPRCRSCGGC
jgi:hypothetical protein